MDFNDTLAAIEEAANAIEAETPTAKIIEGLMTAYNITETQANQILLAVENTRKGTGRKRWGSKAKIGLEAKTPEVDFYT